VARYQTVKLPARTAAAKAVRATFTQRCLLRKAMMAFTLVIMACAAPPLLLAAARNAHFQVSGFGSRSV
jgi:hypothetical protein